MSLETIIKEIKTLKQFAEEDVDSGPTETLSGRRGRKNQAIQRITDLREEYLTELRDSAIFLIVTGNKRTEFEQIATSEKFGLFSSDVNTFYDDLANRVHPSLYTGNASPSNLFDVLGRHLEDKMREIGSREYNQIIFREKYIQPMNNAKEFSQVVKQAINEQMGSEIVGIQAIASIADSALDKGYHGKTTPVVLSTDDDKLALSLYTDLRRLKPIAIVVINAGKASKELKGLDGALSVKEVNEESVGSTLTQIKNSIKK